MPGLTCVAHNNSSSYLIVYFTNCSCLGNYRKAVCLQEATSWLRLDQNDISRCYICCSWYWWRGLVHRSQSRNLLLTTGSNWMANQIWPCYLHCCGKTWTQFCLACYTRSWCVCVARYKQFLLSHLGDDEFKHCPVSARSIAVSANGDVWRVDLEGHLSKCTVDAWDWQSVDGKMASVAVGDDGTLVAINNEHHMFKLSKTKHWDQLPGSAMQISVHNNDHYYIVNKEREIFRAGKF